MLEERFGVFTARREKTQDKLKHRYKPRPIMRHRNTPALWRRYLSARKIMYRQPSLTARTLRNWKMFLLMEASKDPLAVVLILAQREMLNILTPAMGLELPSTPKALKSRMTSKHR
jgi:hypothetical protein